MKYRPQQTVQKLRQANVELGKGLGVKEVCRKIKVSQQTYYRWGQRYGGMNPEMIKELRALQKQNQRLRKNIADQPIRLCHSLREKETCITGQKCILYYII
jgi:DNA invertase Pin-like site-specific DNA recombinase